MFRSKKQLVALLLFVILSLTVASAAYAERGPHRTSQEWWRSRHSQDV